jgi:hypothetical protein
MGIVLPLQPLRQGFKSMAPCVDAFEAAIIDRKICHGNNPLLTYCVANVVADVKPHSLPGTMSASQESDRVRHRPLAIRRHADPAGVSAEWNYGGSKGGIREAGDGSNAQLNYDW